MARLEGLEPPTLCFEGRCSIQLSYRRATTMRNPTIERLVFEFVPHTAAVLSVRHRVDDVVHSDAHAEVGKFERITGRV